MLDMHSLTLLPKKCESPGSLLYRSVFCLYHLAFYLYHIYSECDSGSQQDNDFLIRGRKEKENRIQHDCFRVENGRLGFVRAKLQQGSKAAAGGLSPVTDSCFLSPASQTSYLTASAFPSLYSLHTSALSRQAERQRASVRAGRESIYFSVLLLRS